MKALTQQIKNNPYLKASNLSDLSDCEYAMGEIKNLRTLYGDSKQLDVVWRAVDRKMQKMQNV